MPAMSSSEELDKGDNCKFMWGKKRGVGGKNQDAQFYESFIYDCTEYFLYDCVYLYKDGDPEPYIGKLVKIWEQQNQKKKRIKVLWFFRPTELLNWLHDDDEPLENEIFLASGEGLGLCNVNDLEVIVGKCNVICTSKEKQNPQPSEEELKMADFIFYRVFDVRSYRISDQFEDKVAGIEVKYIFNRKEGIQSISTSKPEANGKDESEKMVENNKALLLKSKINSMEAPVSVSKDKANHITSSTVKDIDVETSTGISKRGNSEDSQLIEDRLFSRKGAGSDENATSKVKQELLSDESMTAQSCDSSKDDAKVGNSLSDSKDKEKQKFIKDGGLENRSLKMARPNENSDKVPPASTLDKDTKTENSARKLRVDFDKEDEKVSETLANNSNDKAKRKPVSDSAGLDKRLAKKAKPNEETALPSEETKHKGVLGLALEKENKTDGQTLEVTRRPDADRSKWFKGFPWEERMQKSREQGTLVLLENLDPSYTSTEIEDIIWHGFRENCTAKVIQRTAFSSPNSGQAFVIFKSREVADMAVRKLDEGCLMLPNGRPLIGRKGILSVPGILAKFVGHLSIEKLKLQMQREEMKRAVSTSHCSQPNTIEYEMAMEWRLMQEKSDTWWKEIYKVHGEELRKLKMSLKRK